MNKPRRRLVVKNNDEEEKAKRTESDDLSQFKIATHKKPQDIDEVCENIRNSVGLSGFHFIKYDALSNVDKKKVEEAMLDMMVTFKYTPIQLGKMILEDLYNKFYAKRKWAPVSERKVREDSLAQTISELTKQ